MENASKALIMAGAVLIAIIIVSLGIIVFRNMSGSVQNNSNLDQEARAQFNSKLTNYIGKNISGSQVNALIQVARAINQKAKNENDTMKRIEITSSSNGTLLSKDNNTTKTVQTGTYYEVNGTYDDYGLLTSITIKP